MILLSILGQGWPVDVGLLALIILVLLWIGLVVIGEDESGLLVRRYGRDLPPGRLIALDGEAGYQAKLLMPGWHFGYWPWKFKIVRVKMIVVRPEELALVVAVDGAEIPTDRILGRDVACDRFQDAEAFIQHGGEKGRQMTVLRAGKYRINPALFQVIQPSNAPEHGLQPQDLRVFEVPPDTVGIVTTADGRPISAGDLAGPAVSGHDAFQNGARFVAAGGCRGLQEEVLLSGAWNLNPWLVRVEANAMTEIPIGYVGVVVSYVGGEHVDVSGDAFTHGDLVEKGKKGVWVEPLLPGKHPINTRIMKVELVPTTNIVLNWAKRTEAHKYDANLSPITVRSRDGFSFNLDVSQIIHIGAKNAPRVISRVGSMQNLVDHVLQPTVANYFRNSAQAVTVLEFLSERSERQREAYEAITKAVAAYDVECIDTLIGDIDPPADLMKTQTDKKIADELTRTYDAQREAQKRRQELARETAIANMQEEVVRSEQLVRIAEKNALAAAEQAKGEAAAYRLKAEAEATGQRLRGDSEADATRAVGAAKADAYRQGIDAVGAENYGAMQLAAILGEHHVKLVPDIAVGGDGAGLAQVLIAKMLTAVVPTSGQ
ncbi:MAG: flotillin family protein [Myxococcales bacterium]|nr:flotillin family protein [Myxococcales bacterium]